MKTEIQSETLWAVYHPEYGFSWTLRGRRHAVITAWENEHGTPWAVAKKQGFRAVKVTLAPSPEVKG